MKSKFSLPPWIREVSYAVLPGRRRVRALIQEINARSIGGQEVHDLLASAITGEKAFSYVRPGGTESEGMYSFVKYRFLRNKFLSGRRYSRFFLENVTPFSGVAFRSRTDLDYFCYRYLEATLSSDLMGFGPYAPGALGIARMRADIGLPVTPFEEVEPIRAVARGIRPWTLSLRGKRVLVVHPFIRTIESQFRRKDQILGVKDALPDFELSVMRPPLSLRASSGDVESWPNQFRQLVAASLENDFDVALIGAGGYGAPLAAAIRASGRTAVHTAGATQLIFGIRGNRWDADTEVSKIIDSSWVRPFEEDMAPEIKTIDLSGPYH